MSSSLRSTRSTKCKRATTTWKPAKTYAASSVFNCHLAVSLGVNPLVIVHALSPLGGKPRLPTNRLLRTVLCRARKPGVWGPNPSKVLRNKGFDKIKYSKYHTEYV